MVKLVYEVDKKILVKNGNNIEIYNEIRRFDLRKLVGDFLRDIEGEFCDFYMYKNVPMYVFLRPAFSVWLTQIIEAVIILSHLKENYDDVELLTDLSYVKKLNEKHFGFRVGSSSCETEDKQQTTGRKRKVSLKRAFKGIKDLLCFMFTRKKRVVMYSMASLLAEDDSCGEIKDPLYGDIQKELERDFHVLNLQVINNEEDYRKSKRYCCNTTPIEILSYIKKVFIRKIQGVELRIPESKRMNVTFNGVDLSGEVAEFLSVRGVKICESYLKEVVLLERLFTKFKVNSTLVIDEGDRGRCFVAAGNIAKIKTFAMQHGIIVENSHSYHLTTDNQLVVPKKTFLWGEKYKELLIENTPCYKEENLIVTGSIRGTERIKRENDNTHRSNGKLKVLFISQYMDELVYPAGEILFHGVDRCKNHVDLTIKLHPTDHRYQEFYEKNLKAKGIQGSITKDKDLYTLMEECDLLVSVHSTAVLEGAQRGIPSICIRTPKFDDVCGFIKDGISLGAEDGKELSEHLNDFKQVFSEEYYNNLEKYIDRCFYNGKKRALDIILKEIRGIV